MRKLNIAAIGLAGGTGLVAGLVWAFRRNPRLGSSFVNSVVNPALIGHGLVGRGRAEIATLEHLGRRSGVRRLTPVYPQPTPDGFRIIVPLGGHSEWARNVIAAGHCRLQLHDVVHELDEPSMVQPSALEGLPRVLRRVEEYLGFQYITLHRFSNAPGCLEPVDGVEPPLPVADASLMTPTEGEAQLASAVTSR